MGRLGACAEDHSAQALEQGILGLRLRLDQGHGVHDAAQGGVLLGIQDRAGALQDLGDPVLMYAAAPVAPPPITAPREMPPARTAASRCRI